MGMRRSCGRQVCWLVAGATLLVACGQAPQSAVPVRRAAGVSKVASRPVPTPTASSSGRTPAPRLEATETPSSNVGDGVEPPASPLIAPGVLVPSAAVAPDEALTGGQDASEASEPVFGLLNDPGWHTEITSVKNGVVLGVGTFRCTVRVWHEDSASQTGVLRVTFKEKGKDSGTPPAVKLLTVAANEVKSITFEDKNWRTREAEAAMVTSSSTQPLAAFVTAKKNGVVLGVGTYRCDVLVVNPMSTSRTGALVVQFLNKGAPAKTPVVRTPLTLAGRASQVFTFTDKNWQTDDVRVAVE